MDKTDNAASRDGDSTEVRKARQDALLAFAQLLARLVADRLGSGPGAPGSGADRVRIGRQEHAASVQ